MTQLLSIDGCSGEVMPVCEKKKQKKEDSHRHVTECLSSSFPNDGSSTCCISNSVKIYVMENMG